MDNQARIILSAVDKTGAAFLLLHKNLEKSETLSEKMAFGMKAIAATTVAAVTVAYVAFDQLVKKAGQFQDMAEKTGDSAQNIASLAVAAGVAGTEMDTVVSAANKLTKNLTGVDDESKAAGAALTALGLDIKTIKGLGAADQFETIAKAMNGFRDGAAKSAVSMALWGKTGAELQVFLRELAGATGRQIILTEEQIKQADEYSDKQAKMRAQLGLHASAIATQMLPAYTAFTETLVDVAKEILAVDSASKKMGQDGTIKTFAEELAIGMAHLADSAFAVAQTINLIGKSYGAAAAIVASPGNFGAISAAAAADGKAMKFNLGLADRLESKFAKMNKASSKAPGALDDSGMLARYGVGTGEAGKKDLKYKGATKDSAEAASALAKAQRDLDLENIKKAGDATAAVFSNAEKVMEALHSAGLIDEADYYTRKKAFLDAGTAAQEDALKSQIERLKQESLAGKDKLENDKKIVDAQAALDKLRADSGTSMSVLQIQETSALRAIAQSYRDAEAAAQDFLDTQIRMQQLSLSGIGAGTQERDRTAGRAQIEDKYSAQRQQLDKSRRDAEFAGTFGTEAQAKYDDELNRIQRFQTSALRQYDAYYAERTAMEADFSKGASEAVANYISEASKSAAQMNDLFGNAFKGMEDALVQFATTGKLSFKELATSIIADLTRIVIKQQVMSPIISAISGISGLAGLFSGAGGGGYDMYGGATGAQNSALMSLIGNASGRASGGPVSAGSLYRVNEAGPELLSVAGKQYLMMGQQGGSVTPNGGAGGSGGVTIINQTRGRIDKVTEQRLSNGERALIIQEAVTATAAQLSDPNSHTSRSMSRNFSVQRSR